MKRPRPVKLRAGFLAGIVAGSECLNRDGQPVGTEFDEFARLPTAEEREAPLPELFAHVPQEPLPEDRDDWRQVRSVVESKEVAIQANPIFIVYRIDFDVLENHISEARTRTKCGYAHSEADAVRWCEDARDAVKTRIYRGWDNRWYPQFDIVSVGELSIQQQGYDQ